MVGPLFPFDINALQKSEAVDLEGLPAKLYCAAPAVCAQMLLPIISKSWE